METAFVGLVKELFYFLVKDFGFALVPSPKDCRRTEVRYISSDKLIGIKIEDDKRSDIVVVFIYRLVDGKFVDNNYSAKGGPIIYCIDFAYILNEPQRMKPGYAYGDSSPYHHPTLGNRNYISEFALRLREQGKDLLNGDLSKFFEAAEIVKEVANEQLRRFRPA
jgi:hypothetical protein